MSKIEIVSQEKNNIQLVLTLDNKFKNVQINIQFYNQNQNRYAHYNYKRINVYATVCNLTIHFAHQDKVSISASAQTIKAQKLNKFIKNKIFNNGKIDISKINSSDQFLHFLKSRLTVLKSKRLLAV